jgi:transposase
MASRKNRKQKCSKTTASLPVLNGDAAGIDIGATELYAAVPHDRADETVRRFDMFTSDLQDLAQWFKDCKIKTVAMESTGVYWIPVFQILESHGFEVCLVNARHVKHVPGRKSDVSDCQWLQYLHAVGLLRGSFRPPDDICAIRAILRHRDRLVNYASAHVQHIQKALNQMNLHLHHVISDITGKTGLAILDAIVSGERDPAKLARLRDPRIKASTEVIQKSLVGDWRDEHLFTLEQALTLYRSYQTLIDQCATKIQSLLKSSHADSAEAPKKEPDVAFDQEKAQSQSETFDLRSELQRLFGTDLTLIPGIAVASVQKLYSEIGSNLKAQFETASRFVSWLGLCPDNRISGGKKLSVKTRDVQCPAATTLRLAAQALHGSKSAMGDYYRRMRTRLGAPKAITAAAAKLARILFHLITTGKSYDESIFERIESEARIRRQGRLFKMARELGFNLVPIESNAT